MSIHIPPQILEAKHVQKRLRALVETLSEDVAGVHYRDPGSDDLAELDREIEDAIVGALLDADLPEQILRGEAAVHAAADRDADRRVA